MVITVRHATREDARAIATVRIVTWRAAYAGMIDDALLDAMDIDREAERRAGAHWERYHADPHACELVAEVDGRIVGWASSGPTRDDDLAGEGELYAIYVLPEHWSTGVGHELMAGSERGLRDAGFDRASLWVLDGNDRAASFYERHGWREDGAVKLDDRIVGGTGARPLPERRRVRELRPSGL